MKLSLIGNTGVIGTVLSKQYSFDYEYNSSNIDLFSSTSHDVVICSAPSSNRLLANQNAQQDLASIQNLINSIQSSPVSRFILISTVDTQHAPNTAYGSNRLMLEQFVQKHYPCHHIIRLCSLIDPSIKKNILFDLKHQQYLDSINVESYLQWYSLNWLKQDIEQIIRDNISEINLVSEPIQTKEIVERFFSRLEIGQHPASVTRYNLTPTRYNKQQVFNEIEKYLNEKT